MNPSDHSARSSAVDALLGILKDAPKDLTARDIREERLSELEERYGILSRAAGKTD